jgi:hypothetical protein
MAWDAERKQWTVQRSELEKQLAATECRLADAIQRMEQLERQLAEVRTQSSTDAVATATMLDAEGEPTPLASVTPSEVWPMRGDNFGHQATAEASVSAQCETGLSNLRAPSGPESPPPVLDFPPAEYEWATAAKRRIPDWPTHDTAPEASQYIETGPAAATPIDPNWSTWRTEAVPTPSGSTTPIADSGRRSPVWSDAPALESAPVVPEDEKREHSEVALAGAATSGAGEFIWPASSSPAPQAEPEDEFAPFAEFSIWNQGARVAESSAGERQFERLESTDERSSVPPDYSAGANANALRDPGVFQSPRTEGSEATGQAAEVPGARSPEQVGEGADVPSAWQPPKPPESTAKKTPQSGSFIERYAHLFAEDDAAAEPAPPPPRPQSSDDELVRKPRSMGAASAATSSTAPPTSSEDEESIEQYMAKLMQRVRGDGPRVAASQAPPAATVANSAALPHPVRDEAAPKAAAASEEQKHAPSMAPPVSEAKPEFLTSLGTVRRQPVTAENSANLEALRALANETARKAISTHALRKHRRDAVTKVIVATLAGMTSIFVMLEAPGWLDLQFITACVSLLVAAYWAGQTYRTMVESFRAAAYDGPEELLENLIDPFRPPLPIDVER